MCTCVCDLKMQINSDLSIINGTYLNRVDCQSEKTVFVRIECESLVLFDEHVVFVPKQVVINWLNM